MTARSIALPIVLLALFFITGESPASTQTDRLPTKTSGAGKNSGVRIVTNIPKAAKERDLALINKFMNLILLGREAEAVTLATDGGYYASGKHTSYSAEKIARLKIFGNPKAKVVAVHYYRDTISKFRHLRYYFVIYETGQHLYPEVMKIELINYDNLFYISKFWAPR
ncbi:MAG TPA: hypothetical protein ENI99_11095 [Sedimenticola sp.]|nr:hypothetical protein [Sedimenticola sp.]